jgi:ribose transport system permease protein
MVNGAEPVRAEAEPVRAEAAPDGAGASPDGELAVPGPPAADVDEGPRGPSWRRSAERFALLALLVAVVVAFALAEPDFRTVANLRVILATQSTLIILALAALFPLIVGQFDLSVAAIMGTSSIVAAGVLSKDHAPLAVAVAAGIASGLIVGAFNGWLVTRVRVNSLIVTLGVATILPGLVDWYSSGLTIVSGIPQSLVNAATGNLLGLPRAFLWIIPVVVIIWYVLTQTPWGRRLEAIGANQEAARLVGVRNDRLVLTSFVVSGGLSALAGVLNLAQNGSADPQTSLGSLLLPALAAVFLGATAFRPGHYNVPGTVVAVFFVAFAVSGLTLAGAAPWVDQVFNGAALIIAVTLSTLAATGGGGGRPASRALRSALRARTSQRAAPGSR